MSVWQWASASFTVLLAASLAACSSSGQSFAGPSVILPATQSVKAPPPGNCPVDHGGSGILPDGDFSQTTDPGNNFYFYFAGEVFAPAWTVSKHSINFAGSTYWNVGHYCSVDLDGNHPGGVYSTMFTTKRGSSYEVSFLLSGNGSFGRSNTATKTMSLKAENQIHVFTWNVSGGNDAQHGRYQNETWTFQADRTETALTFLSQDRKGSTAGPVVADIAVRKR